MSIKYNKKYLELVNQLTQIDSSIIFNKSDDKIKIIRSNNSKTIIYTLDVDKKNFEFESEDIAFYNFPEFYRLLSVFESPEIIEDVNQSKIIVSENKSKIKYKVSDSEVIPKISGGGNIGESDVELMITSTELDQIKKMISLISADRVRFKVKENTKDIICEFFNTGHSNNWENSYDVTKGSSESFSLVIASEVFSLIPKNDYTISILKDGIVKLKYNSEDFDLNLYIPESVDE